VLVTVSPGPDDLANCRPVSAPGQVPADDQALDLVGALEDLHDPASLVVSFEAVRDRRLRGRRTRAGFDPVALASTGLTADEARHDKFKNAPPGILSDGFAGFLGAAAIAATLARRAVEGGSWHINVPLRGVFTPRDGQGGTESDESHTGDPVLAGAPAAHRRIVRRTVPRATVRQRPVPHTRQAIRRRRAVNHAPSATYSIASPNKSGSSHVMSSGPDRAT
jgi:hypothetical protein